MADTDTIRAYWDAAPCGSRHTTCEPGSPAFFADHAARRYRLEPMVAAFAGFDRWAGRRVLELGVGMGADTAEYARRGALVTGVDLSPRSLELTRQRLECERLEAELVEADGAALPFADGSFDLAWSWGVIHHAEDPAAVVAELRRVLAPGGEVRAMLYARRSWFAAGLWARELLRGRPTSVAGAVGRLESPGTRAYTDAELRTLFAGFGSVTVTRWATPYDRRVVGPFASGRLGWFAGVTGRAG